MTYGSPGTYDVGLTVIGPGGDDSSVSSGLVVVANAPQADFSFSTTGLTANFSNLSQGATSYAWDFGDGSTSTEENPSHLYSQPSVYDVVLTVTNVCGTSSFTDIVAFPEAVNEAGQFGYTFNAAPNPFSNQLWVDYELKNTFGKASIVASDVLGRIVGEMPVVAASGKVELGSLIHGSGVYFLRMKVDGQVGEALKIVRF
ncbi:MAG: PKD domain-containing protein [Saprospiraceae bacterium]|nr:PKD domain-containing protein [Saprospiraceae bacterium]MCF8252319.1 PKD domain-containing protein [Saprospiraceae bacterium]MCF8282150.1 PKD domain-containing protein [Bacteroidales bacterium]MCF8313962.1 PKD domain-containing protein [Saprospiraceae bacterium]MCF8442671.1 PKD domain-containing protein [Saprospiraceae bacterium]